MPARTCTIGRYLVERLEQQQVGHVFGIPGDYVLSFFDLLVESSMELVGTCTEIGAGFAADAYARVHGLGVVCVTYCVGGLNVLNAVAGAYAEKSPLVMISGAPGLNEGAEVRTEGELEEALATALTHTQSFSIVNVHLDPRDHSQALARLGKRLGKRIEKTKKAG